MTSSGTSRSTRTPACAQRSSTCSAALSRPAPRTRSSSSSPPKGCAFPGRHLGGPHHGENYWKPLRHDLVLFTLHNPATPARTSTDDASNSPTSTATPAPCIKPRDQWTVLIEDAHPGYVTFEQYEQNQQTLAANAAAHSERSAAPALPAKDRRCCKGWWSAASAASG